MSDTLPNAPPLSDDKARIVFYTPAKLRYATLFARIRLDGDPIGRPIPGRFFFEDVAPGTHEIGIRSEVLRRCEITVAAGKTVYLRISARLGWLTGRFRVDPVAPDTARAEMAGLMRLER